MLSPLSAICTTYAFLDCGLSIHISFISSFKEVLILKVYLFHDLNILSHVVKPCLPKFLRIFSRNIKRCCVCCKGRGSFLNTTLFSHLGWKRTPSPITSLYGKYVWVSFWTVFYPLTDFVLAPTCTVTIAVKHTLESAQARPPAIFLFQNCLGYSGTSEFPYTF
jgi:hypothetical protein